MTTVAQPEPAAVYRLYGVDGTLIYIGSAYDPVGRFRQHEDAPWWTLVARFTEEWHPSRAAAYAAESEAIRAERPRYNIAGLRRREGPRRGGELARARGEVQRRAHREEWETCQRLIKTGVPTGEAMAAGREAFLRIHEESGMFKNYVAKLRREQARP